MKKKIIFTLCVIASIIAICTGCSAKKDKQPTGTYTIETLEEGYYVLSGETFYPLIQDANTSSTSKTVSSDIANQAISTIWVSEQNDVIPVLGKDCKLILSQEDVLPNVIPLYYMTDYGITFGMTLAKTYENNTYALSSSDSKRFCKGSDAEKVFSDLDVDNIRFVDIGDTKITANMITEINTVKDLEKDADYEITYYIGTHYKTQAVTADTHAFSVSRNSVTAITDYGYTKNGFVILNLPENLEKGYYYIESGGMFYYDPDMTGGFMYSDK